MRLADRISRVEASKTLQVKEKALELKARGIKVVDLTAGEPDFPTPSMIGDAGIEAIRNGFTRYTANTGIPELRKKICQKLEKDNGLKYSPEQIIVSNGAKQCILNALFAVAQEGDEVIIAAPYWVSYPEQVKLSGATPVVIDTSATNFKLQAEQLKKHLNRQTRAIIFNSPCNPTGVIYTEQELKSLAKILIPEDIWIITDEIYEKILFDDAQHFSIASLDNLLEKSIVINGFSKSYSMTGWRLGYAAGPLPVIKAMSKVQSHYTSNASSISQKAGIAALDKASVEIQKMRKTFEERRNYIRSVLDGNEYLSYVNPQGAFYFFIDISKAFGAAVNGKQLSNSVDISTFITENYHLVTVPGVAFGADNYIRLSFAAAMEDLQAGMTKLTEAMKALMELKRSH
ncbi:MAG: pyridoxal phosphate-dependent aminotransferase [Calditrichaeota bacterium]|nr:pyridoxal phosphate-dependent aminotransferase [Calditrichota bacterium]RQW02632.1 MAG: pyridoxal phosphate-dependent aminotransferase [Calditrichota bacterium]